MFTLYLYRVLAVSWANLSGWLRLEFGFGLTIKPTYCTYELLPESFLKFLLLREDVVHVDLEVVHNIVEIFIVVGELDFFLNKNKT